VAQRSAARCRSRGNGIVLWQQGGAASRGPGELWANRYTADGGWGAPLRLAPADPAALVLGGELAFDESGRAFVAYVEQAGNQFGLWSRRWNDGWLEPEAVIDTSDDPIVANMTMATRGGEALLLFARQLDNESRVEQACYAAGAGWSAPAVIRDPFGVPLLDMEDSGNALAVWGTPNANGSADLLASRYR